MKRKVLALMLCLTMTLTAVPVSAAADPAPVAEEAVTEDEESAVAEEAVEEESAAVAGESAAEDVVEEATLIENTMAADQGEVESIDTYKTSTAAGVAPILPDSVVAKGLVFDTPTESVISKNNNYDFGEEFNSRLIPVQWEAVDAAKYAQDQVGKTFTVKGTATWDGKTYDAVAEITVNTPAAAGESNSSVTFENVQLTDEFWAPKQETNAMTSLNKAISEIAKESGGEPNFDNAIKRLNGEDYSPQQGFVFQDTDIYKSIESLSYTLSDIQGDTSEEVVAQRTFLEEKLNSWIEKIEKVQYADGYINTFFTLRATNGSSKGGEGDGTHRWRYFSNHEMYNAGHFLEAVVAYTRYREGIGSPDYRLYVAGKRFADEIVTLFGPNGIRHEVPGHEEIELALVKFGKLTEQYEGAGTAQEYYDTAKIFIDRRGEDASLRESGYKGYNYSQDLTPLADEVTAKGHSVRANYFWTGATDVATLLPDGDADKATYMNSLSTIWDAVSTKKTYITGGIGTTAPSADSEGFGDDYVLPNDQSYCEICAAIAAANWNQRMNLLYEDGKYADMVEKNLYNSILVGTNLEGNKYYYSTLLEAVSGNQRSDWFYCACCPPNLMRTLASVSGYMYTVHGDNLFVNMYIGSNGNVTVGDTNVALTQETDYPWDGAVKLTVDPDAAKSFTLKVRIPGWVEEQTDKDVKITVNGQAVTAATEKGYVAITRTWKKGDVVMLDIPMEIRKTEADENVTTNAGRIALQRGPIVYSLEKAGNQQLNSDITDFEPQNIVIPRNAKLKATYNENLLKGVVEITGDAKYSQYGELVPIKIQAIPYYAWNNRGDNADYVENGTDNNYSSKMLIWTMADEAISSSSGSMADDAASMAEVSSDHTYSGARIEGVKMNWEPEASNSGNGLGWSNWNVEGGSEHWLKYDWEQEITTQEMQFYWFDNYDWDRSPGTMIIQYKDENGAWVDATKKLTDEDGVFENDVYNTVKLDKAITTTSIRLLMTVRTEPSTVGSIGCYRWKVIVDKAGIAANVENLINKIGTVDGTSDSRKLIYEARNAYDSLSDEIKAMITNYAVLEAAEAAYDQICTDAAAPVIEAINKIGTVAATEESKALIDAARTAYEALTRAQKARVSNYDVLTAAEERYKELTPDVIDIAKAKVSSISAKKYTGKALKPAVKITYNGKTLTLNKDYAVSYKNNKNIGTAKVTITGKGNYMGTVTRTFKIIVKKSSIYTVGSYKYKITDARTNGKGTVTVTGVKSKSLKSIKVASTVKIGGKSFKITAIGKNAFANCKKAKTASIGKNVTRIYAKAFYNCKVLKKVTIKGKSLKSVGKSAFKNISKKAVVDVPGSKVKAYKKLFKSAGLAKTAKIK